MKVRNGFVSNSSSSSFVVKTNVLTYDQAVALINLDSEPIGRWQDDWSIYLNDDTITGYTTMENGYGEGEGGLQDWLIENGYPLEHFEWEHNN